MKNINYSFIGCGIRSIEYRENLDFKLEGPVEFKEEHSCHFYDFDLETMTQGFLYRLDFGDGQNNTSPYYVGLSVYGEFFIDDIRYLVEIRDEFRAYILREYVLNYINLYFTDILFKSGKFRAEKLSNIGFEHTRGNSIE